MGIWQEEVTDKINGEIELSVMVEMVSYFARKYEI